MDANSNERVNEGKIIGSEFEEVDPSFLKVSKSICKIKTNKQYGTGFFFTNPEQNHSLFEPSKRGSRNCYGLVYEC